MMLCIPSSEPGDRFPLCFPDYPVRDHPGQPEHISCIMLQVEKELISCADLSPDWGTNVPTDINLLNHALQTGKVKPSAVTRVFLQRALDAHHQFNCGKNVL